MDNSLNFCKKQNKISSNDIIEEKLWNDAIEYSSKDVLKMITTKISFPIIEKYKTNVNGNITMNINYNPDIDFDYYTQYTFIHDGTLLFFYEGMRECLRKIINYETYDIRTGIPKLEKNSIAYFTIGNFVIVNEYGYFSDAKPWLQEKTRIMLPIKYSWEYDKNNT